MITEAERQALKVGSMLALGVFSSWRRHRDAIDALILLAITRANIDGILYDRRLRRRYGGANPVAPTSLRQPVSIAVLALSLGFNDRIVLRRVTALALRGECQLTPTGMLITDDQVAASERLNTVHEVYELLRVSCAGLSDLGILSMDHLPPPELADAIPLRSASAHAAKYVLRLLSTVGRSVQGDALDALIMVRLIAADQPLSINSTFDALGLQPVEVNRRLRSLTAAGSCLRNGDDLTCALDEYWFAEVADRNVGHLYQLLAGLAEVGALLDFGRPFSRR